MMRRNLSPFSFLLTCSLLSQFVTLGALAQVAPDAEPTPVPAPSAALVLMPKGAISLQTKSFKVPTGDVLLHLYTIPGARSPELEAITGEKRTGPIKRDDISIGPSLNPSRFFMDVFSKQGATLRRLNSVPFIENKDAAEITMRWLVPAKKQGPVVVMHYGYSHWHEWVLLIFPQGFSGPVTVQEFFWGGEGDSSAIQRLDGIDKNGRMMIAEEETEEGRTTKRSYFWDGVEFSNKSTPYFVIGVSPKTRAEAEAFIAKHKQGYVRPSSHYPKLKPGYYIVVLNRFRTLKEAKAFSNDLPKEGIPYYIKRAF